MKKVLIILALGIMPLSLSTLANADIYTFNISGGNSYVTAASHGGPGPGGTPGTIITGEFNINNALSNDFSGIAYSIDSAELTFDFSDDSSGELIGIPGTTTSDWVGDNLLGYDRDAHTYFNDISETAKIEVENLNYSVTSNSYAASNYIRTDYGYREYTITVPTPPPCISWEGPEPGMGRCIEYGEPGTAEIIRRTEERTHVYQNISGRGGAFGISVSNDIYLTSLMTDGLLGYSISSLLGDFNFTGAFLVVDINAATNPVPEPATMLLLGTGLAGLAGSRIRRKKKA